MKEEILYRNHIDGQSEQMEWEFEQAESFFGGGNKYRWNI